MNTYFLLKNYECKLSLNIKKKPGDYFKPNIFKINIGMNVSKFFFLRKLIAKTINRQNKINSIHTIENSSGLNGPVLLM